MELTTEQKNEAEKIRLAVEAGSAVFANLLKSLDWSPDQTKWEEELYYFVSFVKRQDHERREETN